MVGSSIANSAKKYHEKKKDDKILSNLPQFNTQAINKPIISTKAVIIVALLLSSISFAVAFMINSELITEVVNFTHAIFEFLAVFVLPLSALVTQEKLRNHMRNILH